ncbi:MULTISPECIES: Dph6-related ATP pyrophosphatase [Tenacibaculum]|uniref:Dph6-related ATP pyrophosphatase n=1 Tax=Tenacibaculum TaxID=104267 RepID=UPI000B81318D|nr:MULTISPECIES: diphthine--ammonia ligase [unclassified Tenacibaculum]RBW58247.1 diphthine--ammonia ligase [Tenacibaculum sp. E3R01]
MKKSYFNWSSGKDSSLALYKVLQEKKYSVEKLITNVNKDYQRVSMHGLHESLLIAQADSIGIPLEKIEFPANVTMDLYNQKMKEKTAELKSLGLETAIFGDIFLEDLRNYRDTKLQEVGITGVYPLWKNNTKELLREFLNLGFKTITVCVNAKKLGEEFVGRIIDENFINDLPNDVDVCGENGEFHTFCYDGPIFKKPIKFSIGEKVLKSYTLNDDDSDNCHQNKEEENNKNYDTSFWYCDLKLINE